MTSSSGNDNARYFRLIGRLARHITRMRLPLAGFAAAAIGGGVRRSVPPTINHDPAVAASYNSAAPREQSSPVAKNYATNITATGLLLRMSAADDARAPCCSSSMSSGCAV